MEKLTEKIQALSVNSHSSTNPNNISDPINYINNKSIDNEVDVLFNCSSLIHKNITEFLEKSLTAMSGDSLFEWRESHLKAVMATMCNSKLFQAHLSTLCKSTLQIITVTEDPIWIGDRLYCSR